MVVFHELGENYGPYFSGESRGRKEEGGKGHGPCWSDLGRVEEMRKMLSAAVTEKGGRAGSLQVVVIELRQWNSLGILLLA